MTLNITIVAPWGIWQCSDHRLSRFRDEKLEWYDDNSIKHIIVSCRDGTAMISYTGLGEIEGLHVSDWLREILRGQSRTLDETLMFIREQATLTLAPYRKYHFFNIGAFLAGKPWAVIISNARVAADWAEHPPLSEFNTAAFMVEDKPMPIVTGEKRAIAEKDRQKLLEIAGKRPSRPKDYQMLLAKINKRAAQHPKYGGIISPSCVTCFMPPKGRPIKCTNHRDPTRPGIQKLSPYILFGVDLIEIMQELPKHMKKYRNNIGNSESLELLHRELKKAAERSVRPRRPKKIR
jgi:hypothetical protein